MHLAWFTRSVLCRWWHSNFKLWMCLNRAWYATIFNIQSSGLSRVETDTNFTAACLNWTRHQVFRWKSKEVLAVYYELDSEIRQRDVDDECRLSYLIPFCKDEAKVVIEICSGSISEEEYQEALKILRRRFGQSHMIVKAHFNGLLNGVSIKTTDARVLRKLKRELKNCQNTPPAELYSRPKCFICPVRNGLLGATSSPL